MYKTKFTWMDREGAARSVDSVEMPHLRKGDEFLMMGTHLWAERAYIVVEADGVVWQRVMCVRFPPK